MQVELSTFIEAATQRPGGVLFLTGAGVSAESGIPTFRGKEGYWTVGAREYHPQELATHEAFTQMPLEVWAWYLYRRGVCRAAAPNAAHDALVTIEQHLGDRFGLITQNVDGLHRRAGSRHLHEIHGDIELARCASECTPARWPLGDDIPALHKGDRVPPEVAARLTCPSCGALARPHVLWFDESYDEPRFHLHTVRRLAKGAALLVVAGTSAQTNLPWQVVRIAAETGAAIVDINVEDNPFAEIARETGGLAIRGTAAETLPHIADVVVTA